MQTDPTTQAAPRINLWPVSIVVFFTLAIIGCGTFITFCSRHPADLISPNYYEDEVQYQGQIDRMQRAQEPAQLASIAYEPAKRQIRISLSVGAAQAKAFGKIQLYRPSAVNLDRQLDLQPNKEGIQAIDASDLLPGLWKVRVTWTLGQRDYFLDQPIVIPSRI